MSGRANGCIPWQLPRALTPSQCESHTAVLKSLHRCAVKPCPISRMMLPCDYGNWMPHPVGPRMLCRKRYNLLQDQKKEEPVAAGTCSRKKLMLTSFQVHMQWLHVGHLYPVLVDIFCCCLVAKSSDSATPCTVVYQGLLSMDFSRQEYWNGLPLPSPGDLPNPRNEPAYPALAGGFFYHWATREAWWVYLHRGNQQTYK